MSRVLEVVVSRDNSGVIEFEGVEVYMVGIVDSAWAWEQEDTVEL